MKGKVNTRFFSEKLGFTDIDIVRGLAEPGPVGKE